MSGIKTELLPILFFRRTKKIYEYFANGERLYCSEVEGDTGNVYQQQQQQQQQPRNGVPPPSSTTASPTKSQVGFIEKKLSAIK